MSLFDPRTPPRTSCVALTSCSESESRRSWWRSSICSIEVPRRSTSTRKWFDWIRAKAPPTTADVSASPARRRAMAREISDFDHRRMAPLLLIALSLAAGFRRERPAAAGNYLASRAGRTGCAAAVHGGIRIALRRAEAQTAEVESIAGEVAQRPADEQHGERGCVARESLLEVLLPGDANPAVLGEAGGKRERDVQIVRTAVEQDRVGGSRVCREPVCRLDDADRGRPEYQSLESRAQRAPRGQRRLREHRVFAVDVVDGGERIAAPARVHPEPEQGGRRRHRAVSHRARNLARPHEQQGSEEREVHPSVVADEARRAEEEGGEQSAFAEHQEKRP